jgi:hypothetical protein
MAVTVHYVPMDFIHSIQEENLVTKDYLARIKPHAATFQISDEVWTMGAYHGMDAALEDALGEWAAEQGAGFKDYAFFIGGTDYTKVGDNFPTRESEVLAVWPDLVDRIEDEDRLVG